MLAKLEGTLECLLMTTNSDRKQNCVFQTSSHSPCLCVWCVEVTWCHFSVLRGVGGHSLLLRPYIPAQTLEPGVLEWVCAVVFKARGI